MNFRNTLIVEEVEQLARWKEYLSVNKMLAAAVKVLDKLNNRGYSAYIVGGAVRDIVLGVKPHDVDISSNCPIEVIEQLYHSVDIGKSKDFGITSIKSDGYVFEISRFRSDGVYTDGRRPDKINIELTFEKDAARRDFSLNAMAIDKDGNIIDYFDGKKDIKNKIIRTVGNPKDRFGEDYLRMLRVARFSAKLGFDIEPETKKAAKELANNVTKLSPERIRDELVKAASSSGEVFAKYIIQLDELGILKIILPELVRQHEYKHYKLHHPESDTVWGHTIASLRVNKLEDPLINICILLHDIGKPNTATIRDHGGTAYFGHAEEGMRLVEIIADRLKLSNKERETLIFAVGNHMKFHLILGMSPSKIYKLVSNDNWDALLAVCMADNFSRGPNFKYDIDFNDIVNKAVEIKEKWGKSSMKNVAKLVDGYNVMKLTGLKPSKRVGDIIKAVTAWIIDNNINIADSELVDKKIVEIFNET